jgi:hypothetical protein
MKFLVTCVDGGQDIDLVNCAVVAESRQAQDFDMDWAEVAVARLTDCGTSEYALCVLTRLTWIGWAVERSLISHLFKGNN